MVLHLTRQKLFCDALVLLLLLVDIAKGSIQFLYIFMEFYIPIAVAFYIMFGGEENIAIMKAQGNSADSIANYETFQQMVTTLLPS